MHSRCTHEAPTRAMLFSTLGRSRTIVSIKEWQAPRSGAHGMKNIQKVDIYEDLLENHYLLALYEAKFVVVIM